MSRTVGLDMTAPSEATLANGHDEKHRRTNTTTNHHNEGD